MSLSRKRKKELRKLQTQANSLWESQQVLVDTRRPRGVGFERDEFDVCALEHMPRLSAGRRACIEHAHAVARAKPLARQLRAGILHRNEALLEAWNTLDRHRRGKPHRIAPDRLSRHTLLIEHA